MLGFSEFLNLISGIDKNTLFDAVRPEIVKYAQHKFVDIGTSDAYRQIFEKAFRSTGGEGNFPAIDFENVVADMRKKKVGSDEYRANIRYGHWFYYFSLFSPQCTDPHYGERISEKLFDGTSFYDAFERDMRRHNIPRPRYLPPLKTISLGPITFSFGLQEGLKSLSLQELEETDLKIDGQIGVFRALDWRARLTSLHGRKSEYDNLVRWALGRDQNRVEILLVSGPGGSGKTRLIADAVSHLVFKRGWAGGFLPKVVNPGDVIEGGINGVALIIDYPEERIDLVKKIIEAASDDLICDQPIRIILASRENIESWEEILNIPYLDGVEEIRIGASPYLEMDDALSIAEDVIDEYPKRLGIGGIPVSGIESWLKVHPTHRLPLITLAASVHAVLEPESGFALSGKDVLLALAKIERRRVRSYSKRDLGARKVLEKLLAISVLTKGGLSSFSVSAMGDMRICPGMLGPELVEALQQTPFWCSNGDEPDHLLRLEPDRLAAAFLALTIDFQEDSGKLPDWLCLVVVQDHQDVGTTLGRIAFDISHVDANASVELEMAFIEVLHRYPESLNLLQGIAFHAASAFSNKFSVFVCQRLLEFHAEGEDRAGILQNYAKYLETGGEFTEAKNAIIEAVNLWEAKAEDDEMRTSSELASCLNDAARIHLSCGQKRQAVEFSRRAVELYRKIAINENIPKFELAVALNTHANITKGYISPEERLDFAIESKSIFNDSLKSPSGDRYLHYYASTIGTVGSIFQEMGLFEEAIFQFEKSLECYRRLKSDRPERWAGKLAFVLKDLADVKGDNSNLANALIHAKEAVALLQELSAARPSAFDADLADAYNTISGFYVNLGQIDEGRRCIENAVHLYERLVQNLPGAYAPDLAICLTNFAYLCHFTENGEEAVEIAHAANKAFQMVNEFAPEAYSSSDHLSFSFDRLTQLILKHSGV